MIHIGLCDDDKASLKIISTYLQKFMNEFEKEVRITLFTNGEEIIRYLDEEKRLDIAFLDIDMAGKNGIQTAYELEAFEVEAAGYLVKPVNERKLKRLLVKSLKEAAAEQSRMKLSSLTVTDENIKKKIQQNKILYIEKNRNQSLIYTTEHIYCVYEFLWQINQGLIVNCSYIIKIEKGKVWLKNGLDYTIGRRYLKEVKGKYFDMTKTQD